MDKKIKIRISENAFSKLVIMLNNEKDYTHVRFAYKEGCCGSSKIDIFLDNLKGEDIIDNIDNLPIVYDKEVQDKIKEITLVYRDSSFMINTLLKDAHKKDCSSCKSTCNKGGCMSH